MFDFNAERMSEGELVEAANRIFTAQEADFERIKSEKWYHTLFHAITLNHDGKKYIVRGINSLAKLQQLFMSIYVNNYRKTHEQLDAVIEAVTQNSVAIRNLYAMCVLNIEEQESLERLDSQDAEILALFLGEYRNEYGVVPSAVRDYNRGVLLALNQKIPNGTLDNHQIRRLKAPKVVYRCFMEQCAVNGTIDTQEWTDRIYENLKDFELGENSKHEIKESVKNEAEIAGIEYFFVKYFKNNLGVLDIDFEIDVDASIDSIEAEKKENESEPLMPRFALLQLVCEFDSRLASYASVLFSGRVSSFNNDFVFIENPSEDEIKADIANGVIRLPKLISSINSSYVDYKEMVYAFRFSAIDGGSDNHKNYFLIATIDGLFFFVHNKIAFIEYDALRSVSQDSKGVVISAWNVNWYSEDGLNEFGDNNVFIETSNETNRYLRALRRGMEGIIEEVGGYIESSDDKVERIIAKYIMRIPKDPSSYVPYLVRDFKWDDEKSKKKMKNALSKYAFKVRQDEVVGFIDTSLFGNGGSGILFSKHGIAFDYAFEKIFAKYEEIDRIEIKKGKDLILYGEFSERKDNFSRPSINNIFYNLSVLKECLEEVMYVT